ncbi:MAG: FKBP-type peptidyl-prolyl cis-trans isomerase, partial [Anaerolineales bacterium]
MQIAKDKVVIIDYTLTDDQGDVLDSSEDEEPLSYIQGAGNIIPGLENALEGRAAGDTLKVTVPPEDGYGLRDEELVHVVSRDIFRKAEGLEVGAQFQGRADGEKHVFSVMEIMGVEVTIVAIHPLAGITLL